MNKPLLEFAYRENLSYLEGKLIESILAHKMDQSEKSKEALREAFEWVVPTPAVQKPILGPGVLFGEQLIRESLPVLDPAEYEPWILWKQGDDLPNATQLIAVYMKDAAPDENCSGPAVSFNWDRVSAYCKKKK